MSKNSIIPFLKDYLINFLTRPFLLDTNDAGYKIKRSNLNHPSPNCSFNVSEKSIKSLIKINEGR